MVLRAGPGKCTKRQASFKHITLNKSPWSQITLVDGIMPCHSRNARSDLGIVTEATVIENSRDESHSEQAGAVVTKASVSPQALLTIPSINKNSRPAAKCILLIGSRGSNPMKCAVYVQLQRKQSRHYRTCCCRVSYRLTACVELCVVQWGVVVVCAVECLVVCCVVFQLCMTLCL